MIRPGVKRSLRMLRGQHRPQRDVDEELEVHVALRTQQLIDAGLDPTRAADEAARRLGLTPEVQRELYHAAERRESMIYRREWVSGWLGDLRHATRGLRRDGRFTAFVVLTLALGIGANAAMFSVLDRLLLRGPAHVEDSDQLIRLYLQLDNSAVGALTSPRIPYPLYTILNESVTSFSAITAYAPTEELVDFGGRARPAFLARVAEDFFTTLGVRPALGRLLQKDAIGVTVISHEVWARDFNRDPGVVGRTLLWGENTLTIVGVTPEGFTGPQLDRTDLWIPLDPNRARIRNWEMVARLPPGMTTERALGEVNALYQNAGPPVPRWASEGRVISAPIRFDDVAKEPREASVSRLLMGVTLFVLLIACANVVSLLLARVTHRRNEMAVRLSLGIGQLRLIRLLLAETFMLAVVSALASLPIAYGTGLLFQRVLLPQVAWDASPMSPRVLLLVAVAAGLCGFLVGLFPALNAGRTNVFAALRGGTRHGWDASRTRAHNTLTLVQTALSAVLLLGAGLFLRSYWTIQSTDLGVEPDGAMTVSMRSMSDQLQHGSDTEQILYQRALEVVRSHPGVAAAGLAVGVPFSSTFGEAIFVPGRDSIPQVPGGGPFISSVSPGYFDAIGTPLVRGRLFTEADMSRGERLIIVSESMADVLWNGDALGQCVHVRLATAPCSRVIGIVADVHRFRYREPPSLQYYIPLGQQVGIAGTTMVVRTNSNVAATARDIEVIVGSLDPAIAHVDVAVLRSFLNPESQPWRLGATVLTLCAVLALFVAAAGIYGVLSYRVAQRRKEIGLRLALGASKAAIRTLVMRTGAVPALAGLGLGAVGALAASRWIQPLLFETPVRDPAVLAGVMVALAVAITLASVAPANHASRIDPAGCLNDE